MASVRLVKDANDVRTAISSCIDAAGQLLDMPKSSAEEIAEFRSRYLSWESRTEAILESAFETSGFMAVGPKEDFNGVGLSLLDLKISATALPPERVPEVVADIQERQRVLAAVLDRIDVYDLPARASSQKEPGEGEIFLVHGHDLQRREVVRRFVEQICDRRVIVLDEQPNQGRDILGKLMDNALPALFAIVLLTGDDEGRPSGAQEWRNRARQNVVLELGLFLGLLGRARVAALYEPGVEIPSDYSGVVWIEVTGEQWQIQLARELKEAGIQVSLDQIL